MALVLPTWKIDTEYISFWTGIVFDLNNVYDLICKIHLPFDPYNIKAEDIFKYSNFRF